MDYTIRHANKNIGADLFKKAKDLSGNAERTSGGAKITPNEVTQLLETAKAGDGIVSEEEIRFIAGLTSNENVQKLAAKGFKPTNDEISFQAVSRPRLQSIRQQVERLDTQMSSVERAIRQKPHVMNMMDNINNPNLTQDQRKAMMQSYVDEHGSNYTLASAAAFTDIIGTGSLEFLSHKTLGTKAPDESKMTLHQKRMNKPGLYSPLFDASGKEPMLSILDRLSTSIQEGKTRKPEQLLRNAVLFAKIEGSKNPQRDGIKAIATLMNAVHIGGNKDDGVSAKHNRVLDQMGKAYTSLNDYTTEATTVLMNH